MRWGKVFIFSENLHSKVPKFPLSSRPAGFLLAILFIDPKNHAVFRVVA